MSAVYYSTNGTSSTHNSYIINPALNTFKGRSLSEYIYNLQTTKIGIRGSILDFSFLFQLVKIISVNIVKD